MTDRFHSLTVVLDSDMREDDATELMSAIMMLRGVADVAGIVSDAVANMAAVRARNELEKVLWDALRRPSAPS